PEPGKPLRFDYSRSGNPTRAALEACMAALEGGASGFAFASGCAAATTLLHTLRPGDHVVCGDDVYGGTYRLFEKVLRPLGIETLAVRMQRHGETAAELARRLEGAAGVRRVHYPGLPSHPQHALCRRQMPSGGGMISVELDGDLDHARRFLGAIRIFTLAESLGGVESLV